MASKDNNNPDFHRGLHWINKSNTLFGKQAVNGIPEWVQGIGDTRVTFARGWEEDKIKFNGLIEIGWYFHPDYITFLLRNRTIPKQNAYSDLSRSLSDPHMNPKGKHGGPTFRVHNESDLNIVKQLLLKWLSPESTITFPAATLTVINDGVKSSSGVKPIPVENIEMEEFAKGDEEGRRYFQIQSVIERSERNRQAAIAVHGTACVACGFSFNDAYGKELAKNYIEIHHVNPLAQNQGIVNPSTDLVPLCSNCHSMIHRDPKSVLLLDEIRGLVKQHRNA